MANIQSQYALGRLPTRIAAGAEVVPLWYEIALSAAPLLNDTIEMGPLPAGHTPIDWVLDVADLDSNGTPTIAMSLGLLNSGKTDLSTAAADGGAVWTSGITSGQAGGFTRNASRVLFAVQPAETDRSIALKVTTAAATFQAGTIKLCVLCRANP